MSSIATLKQVAARGRDIASSQVRQHQRRNHESTTGYWWWPAPATPAPSPWRQIVRDLTRPTPMSRWHADVVWERIRSQDRLRPPVTRGALLAAVAVAAARVHPRGRAWWMLAPAVAQVGTEILLHKYVVDNAPPPTAVKVAVEVGQNNFESALLNPSGILGTVACPTNVLFAVSLPAGGTSGWAKVAALGGAILYLNSGLCGAFLDPPNYTEASSMPEFMHSVRPLAPAISCTIVETLVALSIAAGRWERPYRPIAPLTGLLTLLLGSTIRNHDRLLDASNRVLADAVQDARRAMSVTTHNSLQPYKEVVTSVATGDKAPSYEQAALMLRMPAAIRNLLEIANPDHDRDGLIPLDELPRHITRAAAGSRITVDTDIDLPPLSRNHAVLVESVVTGLCWNAAQAIERAEFPADCTNITVRGRAEGEGRGRRYFIQVEDALPPVSNEVLSRSKSFNGVRRAVEHAGGTLTQEPLPGQGKKFVASWVEWTLARPLRPIEEDTQ